MSWEGQTAVMTFGRFQPPTKAHELLFQKVYNLACENGDPWHYVFISPTQDKKRNPLPLLDRYVFLKSKYPTMNFMNTPEIKNPFDAVCCLGKASFGKVIIVCGPDRIEKYETFRKYINHPDITKSIPGIQEIEIVSVGKRDPDSDENLETMSATKARNFVMENDFASFWCCLPKCSIEEAKILFNGVRSGMTK